MRSDMLSSSMASELDDNDHGYNDRDSEFNNSEYYYNPIDDMTNDESSHFEDLVQTYMKDVHYTTITQTALNLTYSMINVGIVMLPFCAYEAGIPVFIACVLFFTGLSAYISSLLVEMAEDERVRSLEALSERAFGARGYFVTCLIQLIFAFTIICVTLGEWGSIIPTVIETNFGDSLPKGLIFNILTDRKFIIIIGSLMALPGCFSRTFSTLSWSSFFTLFTIIVTIVWSLYILYRFLDNPDESNNKNILKVRSLWWTTEVVICFSLSFQQKLFFVFNCLRRRSVARFAPAVKASHLFVALLYITFGCVCALHMTDVTNFKHFNYFKDYKQTNESRVVFDITRTIVSFSLLFTIPVESLVIVTVWRRLWRRYNRYKKSISYISVEQSGGNINDIEHHGVANDDDDESDDESMQRRTAEVNDRVCCFEMSSFFNHQHEDNVQRRDGNYSDDINDPRKQTSSSRQTVSTACTTTNNSVERYLRRVNTFDTPDLLTVPSASYKANTTSDNMKTISSAISETSNTSSGFSGSGSRTPPLTPRTPPRKSRTVSFQDEGASPRPLSSPMRNSNRHNHQNQNHPSHSNTMQRTNRDSHVDMNTSIHLAAESPHLVSQASALSHSHAGSTQQRSSEGTQHSEGTYVNDRASLASSFMGSSVFGDVTGLYSQETDEVRKEGRKLAPAMHSDEGDDSEFLMIVIDFLVLVTSFFIERRSSVGEIEALKPSITERFRTSMPILSVWGLSLVFSVFVYHTVLFSALFITALVTSIFMFLLPSMLYFRLGVKSDFESIPFCGVIPNRLYMYGLQFLGIIFIVGNFVGLCMSLYHNFHDHHTNMHV